MLVLVVNLLGREDRVEELERRIELLERAVRELSELVGRRVEAGEWRSD